MPVTAQVQALLDEFNTLPQPSFDDLSITEARAAAALGSCDLQGEKEVVAEIRNILVPGPASELPVRVYHPAPGTKLPLVVYFHGGGWVLGDLELVDTPLRSVANGANCVVASVNYRLSPETKFPGPAEDCYAATRWLADNAAAIGADDRFVAVAGDSAGGNLAAAVALMARDRATPALAFQVLLYPVIAPATGTTFASYRDNGDGYGLSSEAMVWYWDHYLLSPDDGNNPYAAPLRASDLRGLPPALVVTAEYDLLRDEGLAYAKQLQDAGVSVKASNYPGMIHGFFGMAGVLDEARQVIGEVIGELRRHIAR